MKNLPLTALIALVAGPVVAEDARQLDAHEHGVSALNIAFDGSQIAMELHAPGADIVGFEYEAERAEDKKAIETAVAALGQPMELFGLADAAGCSVVKASAGLEAEEEHEEHGHDEHGHDDHDDHAKKDDDDHAHEEHAEHDELAGEEGHTEFHAEYLLDCSDPSAVTEIAFGYFDAFPNAMEVEVQVISSKGAQQFEVERASPVLDLRGMF